MACPALASTEKTNKLDYLEEAKVVTMFLLVNLQKDHCRNKSLSLPGGHFGAAQRVWLSSALHHHHGRDGHLGAKSAAGAASSEGAAAGS